MASKQAFEKIIPPRHQQDPHRWSVREHGCSSIVGAEIIVQLNDRFCDAIGCTCVGEDQTLTFTGFKRIVCAPYGFPVQRQGQIEGLRLARESGDVDEFS